MSNRPIKKQSKVTTQILVSGILLSIFFLLFTPGFNVSDDVIFMMISSGVFTGEPSEALIYPSPLLGLLLKCLYVWLPFFNWYIVVQYLMLIFVQVQLIKIYDSQNTLWGHYYSAIITLLLLPTYFSLQYTVTAILIGWTGWLLFQEFQQNGRKVNLVLAILSIIFAATLRTKAALLVLIYGSIISFIRVTSKRPVIIASIIGLTITGAIFLFDRSYYHLKFQDGDLRTYLQAIENINGRPNQPDPGEFSIKELSLIKSWFWIDKDLYAKEKIIELGGNIYSQRNITQSLALILNSFSRYPYLYLSLAIFCVGGILRIKTSKDTTLMIMEISTAALIVFYLAYSARIPFRVLYPIGLMVSLQINAQGKSKPMRFYQWLTLISIGGMMMIWTSKISQKNDQNREAFLVSRSWLEQNRDHIIYIRGSQFPYEGSFSIFNTKMQWNHVIPTGYYIFTPNYQQLIRQLNLDNQLTDLCNTQKVMVVSPRIQELSAILNSKYNRNLVFEEEDTPVLKNGKKIPVYSVWCLLKKN